MTARGGRPIWALALAVLVAGVSLYLAYELGRYQSGYSLLDQRRERASLHRQLADEKAVSDELRRQLAIGETSSEIDRATYAQVETTLADLRHTQNLDRDAAERLLLAGKQPTGRLIAPDAVAALIALLCAPESRDITGAAIPIDGGWSAM